MDGLSAAGGVLAVISLALQLAEAVNTIKHFFRNVAEAPRELQRLMQLVLQLDLIVENVIVILKREESKWNGQTSFSRSIQDSILNCKTCLDPAVQFLQDNRSAARKKWGVLKILKSLKVASNDGDIEDIEWRLHRAVTTLDVTLTLNMSNSQYRDTTMITGEIRAVTNEVALLRTDIMSTGKVIEINLEGNKSTETMKTDGLRSRYPLLASRRESTTETRYKTFLGTLCIRQVETTLSFDNDHEHAMKTSATRSKSNWFFIPTFLSRCVELQFRNTYRSIFQGLKVYHIVDDRDPIWSVCCAENGTTFRAYLQHNRHRIDPFIVDSGGYSLLHAAAISKNYETCEVLLQLGMEPGFIIDEDGHDALKTLNPYSHSVPKRGVFPQKTLELFVRYFPECIEGSVLRFWDYLAIGSLEEAIEQWVTRENINLFRDSPILCAMRSMPRARTWPEKFRYIQIIQKLVKMGADVHRFSESSKVSLLHEVLALTEQPWDVSEAFNYWILILFSSGVNTTRYLQVEEDFYNNNNCTFIEDWEGYRRILTLDSDSYGEAVFSWEWWVEPEAAGYEVVKEFKHLDPAMFYWPFRRIFLLTSEAKAFDELQAERFRRKKAAKRAKTKVLDEKQLQLPGAWVE